jgi:Holliday junction resolvasome RuvABC endonuclease subunit
MKRTKENFKILAMDPASKFGWAITDNLYGEWDLTTRKDESMGMKLIRFRSKLDELYNLQKFDLIVYERPAGKHTNPIIHQSKLIAVIEEWCELNKIPYRAYSAGEIKKFATGKGNAGKPMMIESAKEKYDCSKLTDNEADALHLLHLAKQEYKYKY